MEMLGRLLASGLWRIFAPISYSPVDIGGLRGELRGNGVPFEGILIGLYRLHTILLTLAYHYMLHKLQCWMIGI